MRELNFSKFSPITYYLSAMFQTKIGFCIFMQTEVETVVFRSIIKVYIKPYNVFIFEFLCRNQISQKSFRIHSIYLCSNCVFIKKS